MSNTVYRKEFKYILPLSLAKDISLKLSRIMEKDSHGIDGTYFIRSQYYDGLDDQDLMENLDGLYEKSKIRLRVYDLNTDIVKLEYKCKFGEDGIKYSINITKDQALQMEHGEFGFLLDYDDTIAQQLFIKMNMGNYRPKVIVDYSRQAFTYPAGDVRITFDSFIRSSVYPYDLFSNFSTNPLSDEQFILMEVKYSTIFPEQLSWILTEADKLSQSNSKYANARLINY